MNSHSLASLIKSAADNGIFLSLKDGKLSVKVKKDTLTNEDILREIRSHKTALQNWLMQYQAIENPSDFIKKLSPIPDKFPLSGDQERLWLLYQLNDDSSYHVPFAVMLNGKVDAQVLIQAFHVLLQRQQVLSTFFLREGDSLFQKVMNANLWRLEVCNISLEQLQPAIQQEMQVRFDLALNFPIRAKLFKIEDAEDSFCLLITTHHIAIDGQSLPILWQELVNAYNTLAKGLPVAQDPLPIQYREFALWQKHQFETDSFTSKIDFWHKKLTEVPRLELADDYPADNRVAQVGRTFRSKVNAELSASVLNRCSEKGVSPFIYTLAVFKVLLYKYTQQRQICLGFPITERWHAELEPLVGLFVNTLPIYTELSDQETFDSLLEAVKQSVLEAYKYKEVPFEKIVERLSIARDTRINPIFEIVFAAYHSDTATNVTELTNVSVEQVDFETHTAKFALNCAVNIIDGNLTVSMEYDASRYSHDKIAQLTKHYLTLLELCTSNGAQLVRKLNFLDSNDKLIVDQTLLADIPYPLEMTVLSKFEEQVRLYPQNTAIHFDGIDFTYDYLNRRVNQLAHYLIEQGVVLEQPVVVCTHRTPDLLISLLAVMKAGGVYVPVNPAYPEERIRFIIDDCQPQIVITDQADFNVTSSQVICLSKEASIIASYSDTNPAIPIFPNNLLYIIYTSGTTGKPKGVMIEHQNVVRLFFTDSPLFDFGPTDTWTLFHSFCFDFSVWEMYGALLYGGKLVIVNEEQVKDITAFANLLEKEGVTVLNQTPAAFYNLQEELLAIKRSLFLRYIIFGGEALHPSKLASWHSSYPACKLINMYGITETTVHVTYKQIGKREIELGASNIGCAIPTLGCLVLSEDGDLMPPGSIGELFVIGAGLARGYLNRPELTASRFLDNPYNRGTRMYKSGDRVYIGLDGELRYIGRSDAQVKIRGHRIEVGEVENVLLALAEVDKGVVTVFENNGHNRLVAYVVPTVGKSRLDIAMSLQSKLPDFMVPSVIVLLEEIPLTSNGKVDKKRLPSPEKFLIQENTYAAPQHPVEVEICKIWQRLLGVERIGINDNFFDLGGDSIISMQVVNQINKAGFSVSARDIFTYQTIATLAQKILQHQSIQRAEQGILLGELPLLPIQYQFLNDSWSGMHHYNQGFLLAISKQIPVKHIEDALKQIVLRHDSLRIQISRSDAGWHQSYTNCEVSFTTELIDDDEPNQVKAHITDICNGYQQSFHLEKSNLFAAVLICTPTSEEKNRLFLVAHHLIVDAVSWRIILNDLEQLLSNSEREVAVIAKGNSIREWANGLKAYAVSERALAQVPFWQQIVDKYQPIPIDKTASTSFRKDCMEVTVSLDGTYTGWLIKEAHKAYHTEMNDLLLGALLISIGKWIKRHHIVVGLESHGRDGFGSDLNVSNTVGWFTSVYPVELVAMDFSDLEGIVSGVKEQLRTVPDKGIGFGALAYLNPTVALLGSIEQRQPWDIVFNYLGRFDNIIGSDSVLDGALESKGDYCSADTPWRYKLEINCSIQDGQLNMSWTFSQNEFEIPVIESLAKSYLSALKKIIEHCKEQISPKYTPSDFGLAPDVNIEQLNTFLTSPMGRLVQQVCRLSPLQEGMLFHGLYEGKVSSYQEQFTCYLPGDIDVVVLKRSWESLLRKHSILRSCLLPDTFAIPVLCVNKEAVLPFHIIDYSVYDEQERNQLFSRLLETDLSEAIPFNKAPLMRITLVKWDSAGYRMIWTHHHSIMDGWSLSIVLSELIQAYERLSNNLVPENSIEDKYEDYIQFLAQQDVWKAKDFWTQYLSGFTTPTLLPQLKRAGASNRTGGHSNVHVWKPNDILSDQINNFIKSNQLTANTLIQGVWAFLLAKYTNSSDVVYGVTVSGRPSVNDSFQKGIGLYINTIPLRAKLGWEQSISNWLQQIQREQTESREYQYSSLNQIQAWNKLPEDWFDTILIYENYPLADVSANSFALQIEGGTFKERTNYALNIVAGMAPTLRVEFNYNSNLLRLEEVEQICEHFENTIRQFCQPTMLLGDVDILTDSERFRMLQTYNATTRENSTFSSLVQCFEHYVAQIPHRPALIFETDNWTYGELNHIATNLAAQLQAGGVVAGELVGVCMERSAEMIVAILAILKIGAAYVPIDPNYPSERKKYMLSDAGIHSILIAHPDSLHFMDNHAIKQYLVSCKDLFNSALLRCPDLVNIQPHDLAYVIYTSGSTGRPKGVMISHGAALNMSQSLIRLFGIVESDNVLQFASLSFDASVYEICTAFCSGASLTVIRKEIIDDATLFAEYIKRHGVTVATLPPAYLAAIPADCLSGLKLLITAGEAPDAAKAVQLSRQLRYFNAYGPTECAVCVTAHEVFPDDDISNGIPIGTPIDNLRVYILDEHGKLVPEGIIGELFVSGVGLSKGYWKNPELTNAKFIPCPYEKNAMMYKTGDLVRWLPGGRLAYHGRIDHQVKIRGYRIELAEIEQYLKQLSDIHDAVVQVFNNDSDTPLLVAYLVCNEAFDVAMAYAHLSEQLPSFMMPSTFLKIAHIPLTANGKVDIKALPVPIFESISEEQFMLPITAEEGVIMEIWRQLLGEGKWGIHHDFFRLGGHSLLIMRMAAAIKIHLGVQVPVQKIYELRTISKISAYAKQRMWKREIAADTSIEVFEL